MDILITNDDGYQAKGIKILTEIMCQFGSLTVIAPKKHQSGMSMAVSLGLKQIAYKELHGKEVEEKTWNTGKSPENYDTVKWSYLDATPASCVKFGLNTVFEKKFPDVVVSGINHGSNATSASCYSGTLGAAQEAALNGIPAIGVSLSTLNPDADFSAVEKYFPEIFRMIMSNLPERQGIYFNVNFPDIPADRIKGIRTGFQGKGRWVREFKHWDPDIYSHLGITPELLGQSSRPEAEPGEDLYMMVGEYADAPGNTHRSDHWLMNDGYISVVAHNIDTTDYEEVARLENLGFDMDFR